eukprot:s4217_g2.t2
MGAEPPGLQAEWAAAHWQAKSFLHMMLQCEDENQMLSGLGPGAISFDANLPQARMHALPDAGLAVVTSLHDRFWFIVKHHAPKPKDVAKEVLLLSLRSEAANVSKDVAVMRGLSLLLSASAEGYSGEGKAPPLDLTSDRAFFVRLAQLASDWSFHFLELGMVLSLVRFDVVAVTAFEESSFETKAKQALEVSNALQALSHMLGNNEKRAQQSQGQVKEPGSRSAKRLKASHALSMERQLLGVDSESEHGSNNSEASGYNSNEEEGASSGNLARPELADYF